MSTQAVQTASFGNHTIVEFGASRRNATVLHVSKMPDNKAYVITDQTSFHPVDYRWPDQPGDRGRIQVNPETSIPVINSVMAAYEKSSGNILFDRDIVARRNDPNYQFLVAHLVSNSDPENLVGKSVQLVVDPPYCQALSEGHTACHLAALALNMATRDLWKPHSGVSLDSLNSPDFDHTALESSHILEYGSRDEYRLGKSLKKHGFNVEQLNSTLDVVQNKINEILSRWSKNQLTFSLSPERSLLPELRTWSCELPEGKASMPCGGTHVTKFPDHTQIRVQLESREQNMIMHTSVVHS